MDHCSKPNLHPMFVALVAMYWSLPEESRSETRTKPLDKLVSIIAIINIAYTMGKI